MHDLLKPALGMAELRILGACSVDAYCEYLEKGAAMQRRFAEACLPSLPQYPGRNGDIES
jgi:ATP-dependent Clp protease ATP-binding subunit ClpA